MNNITVLYYLLSGPVYYQVMHDRSDLHLLKKEVNREIEYFFEKRYIRLEPWNKRYSKILMAVFTVNLIARHIERKMSKACTLYDKRYSRFAPATMLALREYNRNRSSFIYETDPEIFLRDRIKMVNERVNSYCRDKGRILNTEYLVHGNKRRQKRRKTV